MLSPFLYRFPFPFRFLFRFRFLFLFLFPFLFRIPASGFSRRPNFFTWPCSLYIFHSLCQITQSNHAIFNSTNKFLYTARSRHGYVLLVLMPEPVLYIRLRCEPCIRYSLAAFRQSPRQISNSTSYIFNKLVPRFSLPPVSLSLAPWERVRENPGNEVVFSTQLLNFCLRFSDHWSRQKKPSWGWEMATDRPPPPAPSFIMLCEKGSR